MHEVSQVGLWALSGNDSVQVVHIGLRLPMSPSSLFGNSQSAVILCRGKWQHPAT